MFNRRSPENPCAHAAGASDQPTGNSAPPLRGAACGIVTSEVHGGAGGGRNEHPVGPCAACAAAAGVGVGQEPAVSGPESAEDVLSSLPEFFTVISGATPVPPELAVFGDLAST